MVHWNAETVATMHRGYTTPGGDDRHDDFEAVATVLWPLPGVAVIKGMKGTLGMTFQQKREAYRSLKAHLTQLGAKEVIRDRRGRRETTFTG